MLEERANAEKQRLAEEIQKGVEKRKLEEEFKKNYEETRDERRGSWRDFMKKVSRFSWLFICSSFWPSTLAAPPEAHSSIAHTVVSVHSLSVELLYV